MLLEAEAAVDGDNTSAIEECVGGDLRHRLLTKGGIAREQAESHHRVGLAAAHRLLEFKDGLSVAPGEALQPLAQQRLHADGHVVLAEELGGVVRRLVDDVGEILRSARSSRNRAQSDAARRRP